MGIPVGNTLVYVCVCMHIHVIHHSFRYVRDMCACLDANLSDAEPRHTQTNTNTHAHTHTHLRMHRGGANQVEMTKKEGAAVGQNGPEEPVGAKGLGGVPERIRELRGKMKRTLNLERMICHFR